VKNIWQMTALVDEKTEAEVTVDLPVSTPPAVDAAKFDMDDILRWEDDGGGHFRFRVKSDVFPMLALQIQSK
jgi:hypothetical protein